MQKNTQNVKMSTPSNKHESSRKKKEKKSKRHTVNLFKSFDSKHNQMICGENLIPTKIISRNNTVHQVSYKKEESF